MAFSNPFAAAGTSRRIAHGGAMSVLLLAGASLAACGTSTPSSTLPTITVREWKVETDAGIAARKATFEIKNAGTVEHELLVFKSDLAPSAYPVDDAGDIKEEDPSITVISDGDNLKKGTTQTREIDLSQPGTYLFVCNLPGHFKQGMYKVVTVK